MRREEAEERTEAHAQIQAGSWRLIAADVAAGVPAALGVSTHEWVNRIGHRIKLSISERRTAVAELTADGLTVDDTAAVVNVNERTVKRDRQHLKGTNVPAGPGNGAKDNGSMAVSRTSVPSPLLQLPTHDGRKVPYPEPKADGTFNQTQGDGISWAKWSWNPVTGCLHGCKYCYAREIATSERTKSAFPAGFTPLFHHERLHAPNKTKIPKQYENDPAWRRVFVCSMADLYGKWVPDEWIEEVHASMLAAPQWEYLLLTKFPRRYVGLLLPPNAWVGTSVDEQKRVRLAEDAFRRIEGVAVKWLSLEPLLEPLEFSDLSMFDWIVMGAQTETRQPDGIVPGFAPPPAWWMKIYLQATELDIPVHIKPNLYNGKPGRIPDEYPDI